MNKSTFNGSALISVKVTFSDEVNLSESRSWVTETTQLGAPKSMEVKSNPKELVSALIKCLEKVIAEDLNRKAEEQMAAANAQYKGKAKTDLKCTMTPKRATFEGVNLDPNHTVEDTLKVSGKEFQLEVQVFQQTTTTSTSRCVIN